MKLLIAGMLCLLMTGACGKRRPLQPLPQVNPQNDEQTQLAPKPPSSSNEMTEPSSPPVNTTEDADKTNDIATPQAEQSPGDGTAEQQPSDEEPASESLASASSTTFAEATDDRLRAAGDSQLEQDWGVWLEATQANGSANQSLRYLRGEDQLYRASGLAKLIVAWANLEIDPEARAPNSRRYQQLQQALTEGDNGIFQQIYQDIGGEQTVRDLLSGADIPFPSAFRLVEGSGVSYDNAVSARLIYDILEYSRNSDYGQAFIELFARPMIDPVLRGRLAGLEDSLRARPGVLSRDPSSALAGYGLNPDNQQVIYQFVIIGDGIKDLASGIEAIDETLLDWSDRLTN